MTSCSPSSVALNSAFSQLLSLTAELMNIHRRVHRAVAVSCTTRDHRYTTLADTRRVSALLTYVWLISSKHFPHLTVTEISFLQQWRSMLGRGGAQPPPPDRDQAPKFSRTLDTLWSIGQLILRKNSTFDVTRCQILRLKCTKFDYRWRCTPDLAGGAYSTLPAPLLYLRGPTSKGRKGEEVGEGIGREREGPAPNILS